MATTPRKKKGMTGIETMMTPREYCCFQHIKAFRDVQKKVPGEPFWKKSSKGLIAVLDGSGKEYVAPGLVFGVELDGNGNPMIASYWDPSVPTEGLGSVAPRTLKTVRVLSQTGRIAVRKMPISYDEMCGMVRAVHPGAWVPSEADFWAEYGFVMD